MDSHSGKRLDAHGERHAGSGLVERHLRPRKPTQVVSRSTDPVRPDLVRPSTGGLMSWLLWLIPAWALTSVPVALVLGRVLAARGRQLPRPVAGGCELRLVGAPGGARGPARAERRSVARAAAEPRRSER